MEGEPSPEAAQQAQPPPGGGGGNGPGGQGFPHQAGGEGEVFSSVWDAYAAKAPASDWAGVAWAVILGAGLIALFLYSKVLDRREEERRQIKIQDAARKEEEAVWRAERIAKQKEEREEEEKAEAERKAALRARRKEEEERKTIEMAEAQRRVKEGHQGVLDAHGDEVRAKNEEERLAREERRRKARADHQNGLLAKDTARHEMVGRLQEGVDAAAAVRQVAEMEAAAATLERRRKALEAQHAALIADGAREGRMDAERQARADALQRTLDGLPPPGGVPHGSGGGWYGEESTSPMALDPDLGSRLGVGAWDRPPAPPRYDPLDPRAVAPADAARELQEGTIEISRERRLKAAQDQELQESLAADRAKDARRTREVEKKRRDEEERLARIARIAKQEQDVLARRDALKAKFAEMASPVPGNAAHVRFRLPTGGLMQHKFSGDSPVSELFEYVDAHGGLDAFGFFSLVADYPRRVLRAGEGAAEGTLEDAGLCPQATLLVQPEEDQGSI